MENDQGKSNQQPSQPAVVEKKPEVANIPQDSKVIPIESEKKLAV